MITKGKISRCIIKFSQHSYHEKNLENSEESMLILGLKGRGEILSHV